MSCRINLSRLTSNRKAMKSQVKISFEMKFKITKTTFMMICVIMEIIKELFPLL